MTKKIWILSVGLCLILSLAGCGQDQGGEKTDDVFWETYSGIVEDRFTEGSGSDIRDCLKVDVGEEEPKVFILSGSTEISGADGVSIGDGVEIVCEGNKNSEDNTIIKMTVFQQQEWVKYIFDDSERDVKFSIEYPESWKLIEQRAYDGDENRDASPSTGIGFQFFEDDEERFSILAMGFTYFEVDENLFESELFETSEGLSGTQYTAETDGRVSAYYIFGDEETLPQYIAVVSMSTEHYEILRNDIHTVMRSLSILAD